MKGSGLMKIPTWLTHRPVFTVEDYDQIDGHYDYNSDAKGLSLGIAQWNEQEKVKEISAKAKELLRSGAAPKDLYAALGFSEQANFYRVFKRFFGVTPGEMQKMFKNRQ